VRREKRHRYVSTCGPMAQSFGKTIAQAIDVAENEGWPIATAIAMHRWCQIKIFLQARHRRRSADDRW